MTVSAVLSLLSLLVVLTARFGLRLDLWGEGEDTAIVTENQLRAGETGALDAWEED